MEAKELAEELKRLQEAGRHEADHSSAMIFESKARNLMEDNFDTILSSLETVAGIEKLGESHCVRVGLYYYADGMSEWQVICGEGKIVKLHEDIHAAVRAAVEAAKNEKGN